MAKAHGYVVGIEKLQAVQQSRGNAYQWLMNHANTTLQQATDLLDAIDHGGQQAVVTNVLGLAVVVQRFNRP